MNIYQPLNLLSNPFQFAKNEIRTAVRADKQIWFCAKDVFQALDISWKGSKGSLENYPERWKGVCYLQTPGGPQEAIFISEPAVYRVIFRSEKPEAIRFADWVCEDVLPAIRKTGAYGQVTTKDQISGTQLILSLLRELKKTKDLFARELILKRLSHVCNTLGETLPDTSHIGKDYRQHTLPLAQ